MDPPQQPLPVIPLQYAEAERVGRPGWRTAGRVTAVMAWVTCVLGLVLIHATDTESVVITGPVLFTLGLILILAGALTRRRAVTLLGAAHCAICLLFVALVNLLTWSPDDATQPFTVMGILFTLATGFPTHLVWSRRAEG